MSFPKYQGPECGRCRSGYKPFLAPRWNVALWGGQHLTSLVAPGLRPVPRFAFICKVIVFIYPLLPLPYRILDIDIAPRPSHNRRRIGAQN